MFRDYSKLGQKETLESNCTYWYKYSENFDDFVIAMKLPNGAGVILKSIETFTRHINCPYYIPKSKWNFKQSEWNEITQKEMIESLSKQTP